MDGPPPIPPRPPGYEIITEAAPPLPPRREARPYSFTNQSSQRQPQQTQTQTQTPPPPPPPQQQQQQSQQLYWSTLFYPDGAPQPIFEAFMDAFFTVLDRRNTGSLPPEVVSEFMDVQKFLTKDNTWKANMKPLFGHQPVDQADWEWKFVLEIWYLDHKVVRRFPDREPPQYGGMPLLTREGFKEWMAIESASEPERAFRGLNLAMKHYGVWLQMGPLPRDVLPRATPPKLQERIDDASVRAKREAQNMVDAVKMQCDIAAQGRRAALDLISDNRYVYRYY